MNTHFRCRNCLILDVGWGKQMRHRFWPSPKRFNWIWGPQSPLLNRYRELLRRGYWGYSANLNSCLDLVPTWRLRGSIDQFLHTPSCRVYNDLNFTPNIMTMIKSSIIFGGAWETKDEMKDAHKRSTGKKNYHIMTVSALMEQDGVGFLTPSFYL